MERTRFQYYYYERGIIPHKNVRGVTILNLSTSSYHGLHLCQVKQKYLERFENYGTDTIFILIITKELYSVKNVGGATVLILCTSSNHGLHLY